MFRINLWLLLVAFSTLASVSVNAQVDGAPFTVENASVYKYQSSNVPGQIYELRVALPGSYQNSPDREYPIVVVLDGQWNFTLVADVVGKLAYDGMMPEAITVGVTWGGEGDDPNALRVRDFIRPELPFLPMSGGASQFLTALTEEIIPYVENLYRAGDKRVLLGASYGGLFTSYAMFEKPGFFDGYVAVAGSYFVDGAYFEEKLRSLAQTDALAEVRSFIGVGSLDATAHVEALSDSIRAAKLKGFKNKYQNFKDVGHTGVEPLAYVYGLQYVFERQILKLSEECLQPLVGDYVGGVEGQDSITISVSISGKGRLAIGDASQMTEFVAESETKFYVRGINVTAEFLENGELAVNSQGTVLQFTRAPQ